MESDLLSSPMAQYTTFPITHVTLHGKGKNEGNDHSNGVVGFTVKDRQSLLKPVLGWTVGI
jgi:hypothetical protein